MDVSKNRLLPSILLALGLTLLGASAWANGSGVEQPEPATEEEIFAPDDDPAAPAAGADEEQADGDATVPDDEALQTDEPFGSGPAELEEPAEEPLSGYEAWLRAEEARAAEASRPNHAGAALRSGLLGTALGGLAGLGAYWLADTTPWAIAYGAGSGLVVGTAVGLTNSLLRGDARDDIASRAWLERELPTTYSLPLLDVRF